MLPFIPPYPNKGSGLQVPPWPGIQWDASIWGFSSPISAKQEELFGHKIELNTCMPMEFLLVLTHVKSELNCVFRKIDLMK